MSEFKVSIRDLNTTISEYGRLSSLLSQASQSVSGVKRSLQLQIAQRERINARLTACAGSLSGFHDSVNRLRTTGETVISLYQSTEEKLAGQESPSWHSVIGNLNEEDVSSGTDENNSTLAEFDWIKNIAKVVGKAGVIGSGLSYLYSAATGDAKSFAKGMVRFVGDGVSLIDKVDENGKLSWTDVFKLTKSEKLGFFENLSKQLDGYKISTSNSGWKNAAAVAKWAGDIITVGFTAYDNYKEYDGDLSNGRMWMETISESVLDIGSGMLIGAGVATLMGGAPLLAVGVATAAVSVAVDWALDSVFQGDWKETVSDAILDLGEKAVDSAAKLAKDVGNGVKNAGKSVAKWFKSLF